MLRALAAGRDGPPALGAALPRGLRTALRHQAANFDWIDRPTKVVPLAELAALLREERKLLLRLNAFGHDIQGQAVRDGKDEAADRLRIGARIEVRDERPVDLQHVQRKAPQVAQT